MAKVSLNVVLLLSGTNLHHGQLEAGRLMPLLNSIPVAHPSHLNTLSGESV